MNAISKLLLVLILINPLFGKIKSCNDLITTVDIAECEYQNFQYLEYIRKNVGTKIYIKLPLNKKNIFIDGEKLWKDWFDKLYIELDDPIQFGQEGKIERLILLQNHLKNHIEILQTIKDNQNKITINSKIEIKDEIFNEYKNKFCQILSKNICDNIDLIELNPKNDSVYFLETFKKTPFYDNPVKVSKKIGILEKGLYFNILDEKLEYDKELVRNWLKIQLLNTKKTYWIKAEDIINFHKIQNPRFKIQTQKQPLYKEPNKNTKTKMYLIKNDVVEILEEKEDWIYILYTTKDNKEIKAWIPKNALEFKNNYEEE